MNVLSRSMDSRASTKHSSPHNVLFIRWFILKPLVLKCKTIIIAGTRPHCVFKKMYLNTIHIHLQQVRCEQDNISTHGARHCFVQHILCAHVVGGNQSTRRKLPTVISVNRYHIPREVCRSRDSNQDALFSLPR